MLIAEQSSFDQIYAADLVYIPDCWKLCGDAHCCSFSRYKSRFRMIAKTPFQELPLLPGEYEYLSSKGWLAQFGDFDHRVIEFPIDAGTIRAESIVSTRPGCACNHDTRPTICRLYPLLPVFDIQGRLIDTEPMGIYDEIERIGELTPACKITSLPFDQVKHMLDIATAIAASPRHLFYMEAYRLTKRHVATGLAAQRKSPKDDIFALFEYGFLRRSLVNRDVIRGQLNALYDRFKAHYGDEFSLAQA